MPGTMIFQKYARKMFSNVFRFQYWCNLNFMLTPEVFKLILTSSSTQSLFQQNENRKHSLGLEGMGVARADCSIYIKIYL